MEISRSVKKRFKLLSPSVLTRNKKQGSSPVFYYAIYPCNGFYIAR